MQYIEEYRLEVLDKIGTIYGDNVKKELEIIPVRLTNKGNFLGQINFNVALWEKEEILKALEIKVNYGLAKADIDLAKETIAHELTHGVQSQICESVLLIGPGHRSRPHGKEFKQIMRSLGYPRARASACLSDQLRQSIYFHNLSAKGLDNVL